MVVAGILFGVGPLALVGVAEGDVLSEAVGDWPPTPLEAEDSGEKEVEETVLGASVGVAVASADWGASAPAPEIAPGTGGPAPPPPER